MRITFTIEILIFQEILQNGCGECGLFTPLKGLFMSYLHNAAVTHRSRSSSRWEIEEVRVVSSDEEAVFGLGLLSR